METLNKKPYGAECSIIWTEDGARAEGVFISFLEEKDNDGALYYCEGEGELKTLMTKGMADFIVLEYSLLF